MSDTSAAAHSTSRLEAFSDGVFAIAITLLILDIKVPAAHGAAAEATGAHSLAGKLLALWPNYLAYFMSFAVVLVIWVNHHRIFTIVRRTDQSLLFWNGLLLMFVSLVPFPTALLAEYLHPGTDEFRTAVLVYAGNGVLITGSFHGMWRHAIGHGRLLPEGYDHAFIRRVDEEYRWGPVGYLLVFLIAFVAPVVSLGLCFALVMGFSFQGFMSKRPLRRRTTT